LNTLLYEMVFKKNVIAYTLFGRFARVQKQSYVKTLCLINPVYLSGLLHTLETRDLCFPGWQIQIYHDGILPISVLKVIRKASHVSLHLVEGLRDYPTYVKAGYRFMSLKYNSPDDTDIILFRDIDSPLTQLDATLVEDWRCSTTENSALLSYTASNSSNLSPFAAGGTGIKLSFLSKTNIVFYDEYVPEYYLDLKRTYFSTSNTCRLFDEVYLKDMFEGMSVKRMTMYYEKERWFLDVEKKRILLDYVCDRKLSSNMKFRHTQLLVKNRAVELVTRIPTDVSDHPGYFFARKRNMIYLIDMGELFSKYFGMMPEDNIRR